MKVFITGASGFIGSAVVHEMQQAGHQVVGLARSDASAKKLTDMGVEAHRGDLEDIASLKQGAVAANAVIHLAFVHDFARMNEACEVDRRAIEALGAALVGTQSRFVVAGGLTVMTPGRLRTESDNSVSSQIIARAASEEAVNAVAALGVNTSFVRLPAMVHDRHKQGLASRLVQKAQEVGYSAYVGDGSNRWPAVHRLDAARLFRLALEKGAPGSRFHAVAEEGVTLYDVATAIGDRVNVPVRSQTMDEARAHFGWIAQMVGNDAAASSVLTRAQLGWNPTYAGVLADLKSV